MSIFGYIRVSTKEQNEDRQLIALKEYNIPPVSYTHRDLYKRQGLAVRSMAIRRRRSASVSFLELRGLPLC